MKLASMLLIATLILAPSGVAERSSETGGNGREGAGPLATYSLTWWTVDGGGASYVSGFGADGAAYTLGGAVGQPDAAAQHSTGAYTLRAGFRQPSCVAFTVPPAASHIAIVGGKVQLTWDSGGAYVVHRDTAPYFIPAAPWALNATSPGIDLVGTNVGIRLRTTPTCSPYRVPPASGANVSPSSTLR